MSIRVERKEVVLHLLTANAEIVSARNEAVVSLPPSFSVFSPSLTMKLARGRFLKGPGSKASLSGNCRMRIHPMKEVAIPPVKMTTTLAVIAPAHESLDLLLSATSKRYEVNKADDEVEDGSDARGGLLGGGRSRLVSWSAKSCESGFSSGEVAFTSPVLGRGAVVDCGFPEVFRRCRK